MKQKIQFLVLGVLLLGVSGCREFYDYFNEVEPKILKVQDHATGLTAPLGLDIDAKGQLWVTEVGTGNNDGQVSMITPSGAKHVVYEGFPSAIGPEGLEGLNHFLLKNGWLYILHVNGLLYKANISAYKPGDVPKQASTLPTEDISAFVYDYDFGVALDHSNPYNLTEGPKGDLFITDAGANAVIRRNAAGQLSVFATFPDLKNTTVIGPPFIDAVPTSITYVKQKFYVTTLTGFPFPTGQARVYNVDLAGNVSLYQDGFTTITDMALDPAENPVLVEHAQFGPQGFMRNTGRIVVATATGPSTMIAGLNQPTDIVRANLWLYYVNSLADGKILKVSPQ